MEAHRYAEQGHKKGNLIVTVAPYLGPGSAAVDKRLRRGLQSAHRQIGARVEAKIEMGLRLLRY